MNHLNPIRPTSPASPLDTEALLEIITQAAELQRLRPGTPDSFERYIIGALKSREEGHGPAVRWARKAIESMHDYARDRAA